MDNIDGKNCLFIFTLKKYSDNYLKSLTCFVSWKCKPSENDHHIRS